MLNKLISLIALVVMLVVAAVPMMAQDTQTVTTVGGNIVVRSGPGLQYMGIGNLPEDGTLSVTGRNDFDTTRQCVTPFEVTADMWLRVDLQGVEGWVARCAVIYNGQLSQLPVAEPINPIETYVGGFECACDVFVNHVLGDAPVTTYIIGHTRYPRLYVHQSPSLTSDSELAEIGSMYVIGQSADGYWVQVQYDIETHAVPNPDAHTVARTGWVARYLMLLPSSWETTLPVK
jgi:hypothetical protein